MMIEKYFSWIDGWGSNTYFVQTEVIQWDTWMYSSWFTTPLLVILSILTVISVMYLFIEDEPSGIGIPSIVAYFILPQLLYLIVHCWELSILLSIIAIIIWWKPFRSTIFKLKQKKKSKIEQQKKQL